MEKQLFINGRQQKARSKSTIDVTNPATGQVVASIPDASAEDIDAAVTAARAAFESGWAETSQQQRSSILRQIARAIRERADELAEIEVAETGRPITEIKALDVPETADCFEYYAAAARLLKGQTIPMPGSFLDYTVLEPVGVVGQIVPWNFPLNLASWKVAPALATGNCVVLKPSELTPSSALVLAEIACEAGLPPGVLNIVTGLGHTAGAALVSHPDVDMIAFTGSTSTGRLISEAAARDGKRVALELGGKSAQILFADCDLTAALPSVLEGAFFAQGENCCAGSRILVHASIRGELLAQLETLASKLRIGMPTDPATQIGCLVSMHHFERVRSYLAGVRSEGGSILVGGDVPEGSAFARKPFLAPTVIVDPPFRSRIVQEEVFGPVLVVNTFDDEDEAVRLANGTRYDLAAGIWTRDVSRAHRVARRLRAGSVWVNTYNRVFNDAPFGGYRWSGEGRDLGSEALTKYVQVKNVCISYQPGSDPWFAV